MRIVSWNMNQRGREAWAFLLGTLDPDVALVQEAIVPRDIVDDYQVLWTSAWPEGACFALDRPPSRRARLLRSLATRYLETMLLRRLAMVRAGCFASQEQRAMPTSSALQRLTPETQPATCVTTISSATQRTSWG